MGAWEPGIYGNDEALELVDEVTGGGGLESLREALARAISVREDLLEAPEANQALAAADIVSRLRPRNVPADSGVDALQLWLEDADFFAGADTVAQARAAVGRVLRKPSELMELWSETGSLDPGWAAEVERVLRRLA